MKVAFTQDTFGLHIAYRNGRSSKNLLVNELTLDTRPGELTLEMDVGRSLLGQSKDSNAYLDFHELGAEHAHLSLAHLEVGKGTAALDSAIERHPDAEVRLALKVGKHGRFEYRTRYVNGGTRAEFTILSLLTKPATRSQG